MSERTVPHPVAFRAVLAVLGVTQTVNGVWATFFPRSFYDDFPAGRGGWVSTLGPFDEHLMTDVGALFLATGVLMLIAAVRLERTLSAIALVVWLLWATPHAAWHLAELGQMSTGDAIAEGIAVTLTVLAPLWLLALLRRAERPAAPRAAAPGSSGARLALVERTRNPLVRYVFRETRRKMGRVGTPVAAHAHHPTLLLGWGAFEQATMRARRVPARVKSLAVMRAAALSGCEWCLDFGSHEALAMGVSEEDLRALVAYRDSERFDDVEKLVLDYATGMTRTPVDVSGELFARLREHFDEAQLVELTSVIALENYRARFNWALGLGGEGYSEGAYCMRPEPAEPARAAAGSVG